MATGFNGELRGVAHDLRIIGDRTLKRRPEPWHQKPASQTVINARVANLASRGQASVGAAIRELAKQFWVALIQDGFTDGSPRKLGDDRAFVAIVKCLSEMPF